MNDSSQLAKVLVVDDEETMRFTLKTFLCDAGFDVAVAPDATSAGIAFMENDFQVALVDRILARGEDGVDVIRRLRHTNPFCETILLTAHPTFESAASTLKTGAFDYLVKPVTRDIVCKAVQEAALAAAKKRSERTGLSLFQAIAKTAPIPIAVFDEDGNMELANTAFYKAYGLEKASLLDSGDGFADEADIEKNRAEFQALISGDCSEFQRETRRKTRDGVVHMVTQHMFACGCYPSLPTRQIVVMDQDITDMRHIENRLLHADRLTTLGKISGSMMHEIKNSLQAVAGYAQLALVKDPVKSSAEPEMCKIIDAAKGVNEMCDLVKSMIRRDDIEFSLVNAHDALEKALTTLIKAGALRDTSIHRHYCGQNIIIHGNALLLQQVFINLIMNAAHAMENRQKKTLYVGISCESAKQMADIFVRDTGCGIPKEQRSKIFEPFYSTYLHKGGTGLGLSIVKQIVELHFGSINVASVVDRGSVFTVSLPLADQKNVQNE